MIPVNVVMQIGMKAFQLIFKPSKVSVVALVILPWPDFGVRVEEPGRLFR